MTPKIHLLRRNTTLSARQITKPSSQNLRAKDLTILETWSTTWRGRLATTSFLPTVTWLSYDNSTPNEVMLTPIWTIRSVSLYRSAAELDTVGIWILDFFKVRFQMVGFSNGWALTIPTIWKPDRSESVRFLSRVLMVLDRMAAICPDFQYLCVHFGAASSGSW